MQPTKNYSRKLSLLVAVLILLTGVFLGGYLVLKSGKVSAGQIDDILKGAPIVTETCEPNASDPNKDSDNDGLKDWQEIQVYKSDPCKPDTDGDGYLDGEEVASGYDPTIKAPGDELPGTMAKSPRPLPANLTKALSSALAQQIVSGKIDSFNQQGQILSADELAKYPAIQQSVAQLMSAGDQLFAPETIDAIRIKTTPDNSATSIQNYAKAAANAIPITDSSDEETEASMFLSAINNNDFSKLDLYLKDYQIAYRKLQEITVPDDLVNLHKEQLNIFSSIIRIYEAIKNSGDDPLKTNLALQKYQELSTQFGNWMQKLGQFIDAHQ
ncbi:MAG: Thrombospondin type 3 repeat superfamily protein [Parcubacteria group bacterium GW2011_GWA2_43_9b]|nr:MAG: Thrombospondin type 3 repeat superfamily protein [Parcubacteria group bacterium GW2011_GWA2_43_9b]